MKFHLTPPITRTTTPAGDEIAIKIAPPSGPLRRSRSARSFEIATHVIATCGDRLVAEPVAVVRDRRPAYVYRWVVGDTFAECENISTDTTEAIAQAVADLHAVRVRHRDLNGTNVLLSPSRGVCFLDLDGARILRSPPGLRIRARDLARLALAYEVRGLPYVDLVDAYFRAAGLGAAKRERFDARIRARIARWKSGARTPTR